MRFGGKSLRGRVGRLIACLLCLSLFFLQVSLRASLKTHDSLGVIVDHVGDRYGRHHLEEVGCDAFVEPSQSFSLESFACDVPDAAVHWRMNGCPLALQPRPYDVDGIYHTCT